MAKLLLSRLATFGAAAVLSGFLLMIYPYYPIGIVVILALAMGIIGLEFPNIALMLATLLSVIGAMYQSSLAGLTFLIVFFVTLTLAVRWLDLACVVATWILALLAPLPSLAIAPTLFAGLHRSREDAVKVGVVSAFSIFLLGWTKGMMQAGLMLVPFPSNYVAKAIPDPWRFTEFIPSADVLTTTHLTNYYAPLASSLGDFRIYALIATWAIGAYLTAFLASRLKGSKYYAAALLGVVPAVIVSSLFAHPPLLGIAMVLAVSAIIPPAYKFLEPVAEKLSQVKKPATIMFTDIVGYTAITEKNEALALRILEAQKKVLRPIFEKHHGLEIKTIGDAFLVEFASSLAAVKCAVEIQRKLQRLKLAGHETKLHIGIHVGDVVHREGDVFGDVVNIAARIEPLAKPGEICISRQVYEQISKKTKYKVTSLGPQNLKNVQYPVEVYRVSLGRT
jgi:class 3 adenylate cyclase